MARTRTTVRPPNPPRKKQAFVDILDELADVCEKLGDGGRAKAFLVASEKMRSHDDGSDVLSEESPAVYAKVEGVGEAALELMHEFVTYQDNWSPSGELEIATELKEKLLERRKDAARAAARKIHARTGGGGDAAPPGPTPALPSEVLAEIFYIVSRDTSPDVGLRNVLRASQTCRGWRDAERESRWLWRSIREDRFGADPNEARSIHWFPYDRVRVVNADP
jgi:hypothetical protein